MRSIFVLFVLCCAVSLISGEGFLDDKSSEKSEKKSGRIALSRSENVREGSPIGSKDDDDSDSSKRADKIDKKIEKSIEQSEEVERTTKRRKPKTTTEKSNEKPSDYTDDEDESKSESKKKGRGKSTKSKDSFNDNGQAAYDIARWIFGKTNEFRTQNK